MNEPNKEANAVTEEDITSWLGRFEGYRVSVTAERIEEWINNFNSEAYLGAKVLDAVFYIKSEHMEAALRDMVDKLPGWHKNETKRHGKWRFVAFSSSAGESGDTMLHKSRTALGLTGTKYNGLFVHKAELLRARLGPEDNVVFFDDFAGTGNQACNAWVTFSELLPENPKTYLILVAAGVRAIRRINDETGLTVHARHTLGPDCDIFSDDCKSFTESEKTRLLHYCRKADRNNPQGYGNCGFLVVLAHKTPNNSIPVLHANHGRWRGLFPRY